MTTHTIHPFGERAILVTLPKETSPTAVGHALESELGVSARVGLDTVLITSAHLPTAEAIDSIIRRTPTTAIDTHSRHITIPVHYTGEDLSHVAELLHMTTDDVVAAHQNITWRVALVGFAPGFPYLVPADSASLFADIPRLSTPRTAVPVGSVAVAAGMSAVYPNSMPGGWMILGHTDIPLFEPESPQPSLLTAGDTVTFVEVRA